LACRRALRKQGSLALWSAEPSKVFEQLLISCGFKVRRYRAKSYQGGNSKPFFIWVAAEDKTMLPPGAASRACKVGRYPGKAADREENGQCVLWLKEAPVKPGIMGSVAVFRSATLSDANAISEVYLASRKQFLPYAPLAHTDEQVRAWIANQLIPNSDVIVALVDNEIVGMMAVSQNDVAS